MTSQTDKGYSFGGSSCHHGLRYACILCDKEQQARERHKVGCGDGDTYIKTDNTQALYNALAEIDRLKRQVDVLRDGLKIMATKEYPAFGFRRDAANSFIAAADKINQPKE